MNTKNSYKGDRLEKKNHARGKCQMNMAVNVKKIIPTKKKGWGKNSC